MLHDFLGNNRDELIARCREKVAKRPLRQATAGQLANGVPMFLDQLIRTLKIEQGSQPMDSRAISGPDGGGIALSEMGVSAAQHGAQLLTLGFSVDQVVHDYGDLCQAITDLAFERDAPFQVDEFRTLNRCLDNAIADAVAEFSFQRDSVIEEGYELEANKRLGFFAHELRNLLNSATLAFQASEAGNLHLSGATGAVLKRSLAGLNTLIERSLADVRKGVHGVPVAVFALHDFIDEAAATAELVASAKQSSLLVTQKDTSLAISGDRDFLLMALGNLLQNAIKFSHQGAQINLNAYASGDRILVDVADQCGGLPAGDLEHMFEPFSQMNADKTGMGLGLSIARRTIESNGGTLTVRDIPGNGCVFTISLPRRSLA
jgi:signal transduction histidine kinase